MLAVHFAPDKDEILTLGLALAMDHPVEACFLCNYGPDAMFKWLKRAQWGASHHIHLGRSHPGGFPRDTVASQDWCQRWAVPIDVLRRWMNDGARPLGNNDDAQALPFRGHPDSGMCHIWLELLLFWIEDGPSREPRNLIRRTHSDGLRRRLCSDQ